MSLNFYIYTLLVLIKLVYLPLDVSCKPESLNFSVVASLHDPIKNNVLPLSLFENALDEDQSFNEVVENYLYFVHLLPV